MFLLSLNMSHVLSSDSCIGSLDANQCVVDNGGCQQLCTNAHPGVTCGCMTGYSLNADAINCTGMYAQCALLRM